MSAATLASAIASCVSDYDPDALPVAVAQAIIAGYLPACRERRVTEELPLRDTLGRTLAAEIRSTINVPAHDNSAMDGYAVRGADLSTSTATPLRRIGESFAGRPFTGRVGSGE